MQVIGRIDFFDDEALRKKLFRLSLLLMLPAIVLMFVQGIYSGSHTSADETLFNVFPEGFEFLEWLLVLALVSIAILPIHELIHGLFFKLVGRPGLHVTYGFKSGMLYAGCPGEVFPKASMAIVLVAPTFFITAICLVVTFISGYTMLCLAIMFTHLSGCTGDLIALWTLYKAQDCTYCEDTSYGLKLLSKDRVC